jgi:hypothetical protein
MPENQAGMSWGINIQFEFIDTEVITERLLTRW